MIWITWRQHRGALAGIFALLGSLSLLLLLNGLAMRAALRDLGLTACHPMTMPRCAAQLNQFGAEYGGWAMYVPRFTEFAPMLIGAFSGGPLLARELESGTFRFAWTQGAGRTRWLIAKLALLAAAVTAAAAAFTLLFSWWYQPLFAAGESLMTPRVFDMTGVDFAAWTLFAFALGAFAGVVIRRVVPAIAVTMAGWIAVALSAALYLRFRYQPPVVVRATAPLPPRAYLLGTWMQTADGHRVSPRAVAQRLIAQNLPRSKWQAWAAAHDYTWWKAYQPESRFWHFQAIEGGSLLALALLLGAATLWWARRRTA